MLSSHVGVLRAADDTVSHNSQVFDKILRNIRKANEFLFLLQYFWKIMGPVKKK